MSGNFAEMMTPTPFRDTLHAANLRHGTDGFTSPPKEGVLRIFSPLKIRRLRPGLNPRTWLDWYSLSVIIIVIRSRRVRWAGHVAGIGEMRNGYKNVDVERGLYSY